MKISEIGRYLESVCPLSLQEEYDNCGFLAGDPSADFSGALLCLDVTEEIMQEAVDNRCNLVISHHPFIFKGLKKLTPAQPETAIITRALKNNIAIYAIHTNLDNSLRGLNAFVLSKLGIREFKILAPKTGMLLKLVTFCPHSHADKVRSALFDAGAGHIGNYDCCSYNLEGKGTFRASDSANPFVGEKNSLHVEPEIRIEVIFPDHLEGRILDALTGSHPYEEVAYDLYPLKNANPLAGSGLTGTFDQPLDRKAFLELLKTVFSLPVIRHSKTDLAEIKTVALCTGSGAFLIPDAVKAGADAYLTSDLKYHDFPGEGGKLLLADIGHYESEQWVKEWLHAVLTEKFPTFAFLISETDTNPVRYY